MEDDDDHALIATRVLTRRPGWEVTRAATLQGAVERLAHDDFDVAIVDYRLPDGSGIELLDVLRSKRPGLPILFFTAHGSEEVAMEAMSRGATDYIVKGPDYVQEITARVEQALASGGGVVRVTAAAAAGGRSGEAPSPSKGPTFNKEALTRALKTLDTRQVAGAVIYDASANPLAAMLPANVESGALGRALIHAVSHAQHTLRQVPDAGPPRVLLLHHAGGFLAVSAVPGPLFVVLLLEKGVTADQALMRAQDAAAKAWEASRV